MLRSDGASNRLATACLTAVVWNYHLIIRQRLQICKRRRLYSRGLRVNINASDNPARGHGFLGTVASSNKRPGQPEKRSGMPAG